jgi:hypothetical protein
LKRREFITLLGGATAWPLAARAQQPEHIRRIGALIGGAAETDPESRSRVAALQEALTQRGWSEGRNIRIDYYWAGTDSDRIHAFNVESIATPVEDTAGVEHALASLAVGANGGLVVNADIFATRNRAAIIAAAARHRVPAIYPFAFFVASGGLVAYGCDIADLWRRAAAYLDRILRGEKPSDLPVQAPTKFELGINLKTAKALGLDVPPTLLALADEVIE